MLMRVEVDGLFAGWNDPAMPARYHLNVVGDFYVEADCCTHCGVPRATAPTLFDEDDAQCFVARQPANEQELKRMLDVLAGQELGCIRYAGRNLDVIATTESWGDPLGVVDAPAWLRAVARVFGRKLPITTGRKSSS
ncbi:MAG: ferredoxin [Polyangiaceae bacterium]